MEGLVENSPYRKALRRSEVDNLPVALAYPPDLGVAEVRRVLSITHACEDQVGALVACIHLSKGKRRNSMHILWLKKEKETHLKSMHGTPFSIFRRAWVMFSIWLRRRAP